MVNQSVLDSSVDLEQLKDIEELTPDMDRTISEKVETFLDKSGDQPYAHMNEGYVVVVQMTRELEAGGLYSFEEDEAERACRRLELAQESRHQGMLVGWR